MAIYAVHSPTLDGDPASAFDRAKVLRLGFSFWAFAFGPLWLLAKQVWLALGAWILGAAIVGLAVAFGVLQPGAGLSLYWLAALFLGIEGRALQSWALTRRGLPLADVVAAGDSETAERGFLTRALASPPSAGSRAGNPASPGANEIIGLFPRAGG
jgi:hypothetical protein